MKTISNSDYRVSLGRASQVTLGANFGIPEKTGLYVAGAGLCER